MRRPLVSLPVWFPLLALLLTAAPAVRAADPQPYTTDIASTGNSALDAALKGSSSLLSLQKTAPVGPFALVERARQDVGRFQTALNSFGYYKAQVNLTIDDHPLSDPTLVNTLDALPAQRPVPVVAKFDLGPQFHLGQVAIDGSVPPGAASSLELHTGQPAIASDVLAAQGRLLAAIRNAGHPLAAVPVPVATLHPDQNLLDVVFHPDSGPQADIGPITITGLKDMNESFVRRRLLLHRGEQFSPEALEKARQDLMSLGVFSTIRMVPADHLDANGNLPVTIDVTEAPLHSVDLGIAYSTDLGVNFNAGWHDHNLFGNAEQLNLTAAMQLGGNAVIRPGYSFGAQFLKPDFMARDQQLELDLNAIKQSLQAYDQTALLEKAALNRKLSEYWTVSAGLSGEQESITQEDVTTHYDLVGIPLSATYNSSNSLLNPTTGLRLTLSATPTESLGTPNSTFLITQAAGSTYFDLSGNGRSVLALRGLVGKVWGAGVFDLPPDQRFYAGGSGTVRGYRYQSVGPQFPNRIPTGGTAVSAGTVEFRQRILGNYGVVAFVDAGQVSNTGAPFTQGYRIGVGVGARYYTSIGPIRLDVAVPLNKEPGGDSFELYIGIGQAF